MNRRTLRSKPSRGRAMRTSSRTRLGLSNITRIPCTLPPCYVISSSIAACHEHEIATHSYDSFNIWFCPDAPNGSSRQCKLGFYTEEDFIAHRQSRHMKPTDSDSYGESDRYFLGPQLGRMFWCGFCRQVFNIGQNEWSFSRCKHIAYHFTATPVRQYTPDGTLIVTFNHDEPSGTKRGDWTMIEMWKPEKETFSECPVSGSIQAILGENPMSELGLRSRHNDIRTSEEWL